MVPILFVAIFLAAPFVSAQAVAFERGPRPTPVRPIEGADVTCETTGILVSLDHDEKRMWISDEDTGTANGYQLPTISYSRTGRYSAYIEGDAFLYGRHVTTLFVLQELKSSVVEAVPRLVGTLKIFGPTGEEDIVANFRCSLMDGFGGFYATTSESL